MSKELKKITEGTKKDREIKWFPELSDKRKSASCSYYKPFFHQLGKSIKFHLYAVKTEVGMSHSLVGISYSQSGGTKCWWENPTCRLGHHTHEVVGLNVDGKIPLTVIMPFTYT